MKVASGVFHWVPILLPSAPGPTTKGLVKMCRVSQGSLVPAEPPATAPSTEVKAARGPGLTEGRTFKMVLFIYAESLKVPQMEPLK